MNRSESKYYHTAVRMDEALLELLEKKEFEYVTVKEICETAGVNRSTFYLHYETVGDLLAECLEYVRHQCFDRYDGKRKDIRHRISDAELKDLIFITPEYLLPYFEFVKENKRLFRIATYHPEVLGTDKIFTRMFNDVFSPIFDRFHYPNDRKHYAIAFYVSGLIAIVSVWIKNDCADPIEKVIDVCIECILPHGIDAFLPGTSVTVQDDHTEGKA